MKKNKVSLRLDANVVKALREADKNAIIRDFFKKHSGDDKLSYPLGFLKNKLYAVNLSPENIDRVGKLAVKFNTTSSEIVRTAVLWWYMRM